MKKLLALLTALFVSIFNNVEFTTTADRVYTADNYYKVDEADPPDYRDIYNFSPTASGKDNCKTANWSSNGREIKYDATTPADTTKGMWFENRVDKSISDAELSGHTYTFTNSGYIIAPYDCTLQSSSKTNSGHDMVVVVELDGVKYRLTFSKMERWYCCMRKSADMDANANILDYLWVHNSDEQQGKTFDRGCVLGSSISGETTVTIVKLNALGESDTTFQEMYLNQ